MYLRQKKEIRTASNIRYIVRMSLTKSDSLCESDEQKSVLQKTSLESEVRLVNTTFVMMWEQHQQYYKSQGPIT